MWQLEIGKGKGSRFRLGLKFVGFKVLSLDSSVLKFRVISPKVFGPILLHYSRVKPFCFCYNLKRPFFWKIQPIGVYNQRWIYWFPHRKLCFKPCLCFDWNIPIEEDKCPFLIGTLKRLHASFNVRMKVVSAMGWLLLLNRSKT